MGAWGIALQQFGQGGGPGLVHGGTNGHFHRLEIQSARLAALAENQLQQVLYFAGDFLPDRFGRFFSSGV